MTVRDELKKLIGQAIAELGGGEVDFSVEYPQQPGHGDYATNVALRSTKTFRKSPMEIAAMLAGKIAEHEPARALFENIEPAKPGFVNFFLSPAFLQRTVAEILKSREAYGRTATHKGKKINIEFVSANPTGPLTLANGRGGFFGDALGNVLAEAGAKVTKEYYVNDAGNQIRTLGESVLAAAGLLERREYHYQGSYIASYAEEFGKYLALKEFLQDPEALGRKVADAILGREIKPALERAGIHFDVWTSEAGDIREKGLVEKALAELRKRGFIYAKDGAEWLKTSAFGDTEDRVLVRSDTLRDYTYIAVDIPYHLEKWRRGSDVLINVWGADHHGDVARLQAAMRMLEKPPVTVILMQLVRLTEQGREVRMSKRTGTFVTLRELLDDVGVDVARFFFLERQPDTHMDFDLTLAKDTSEKNPVYYVQYAHARVAAILRKAKETAPASGSVGTPLALLSSPEEIALIRKLARFPELVEDVAATYEMHRLPRYAVELATAFHKFYDTNRVLGQDRGLTAARLALLGAAQIVLQKVLGLMGIGAPERM